MYFYMIISPIVAMLYFEHSAKIVYQKSDIILDNKNNNRILHDHSKENIMSFELRWMLWSMFGGGNDTDDYIGIS